MQIELNIDSLSMTGFTGMNFLHFGIALQSEIARLFDDLGVPTGLKCSWQGAEIQFSQVILPSGAQPELAATYVARALYDGLNGISAVPVSSKE